MSVFTTVTAEQLHLWLRAYPLGELLDLQGIASGITNTNYFVTTSGGRYVLTLFEKNTVDELPFFLNLMAHLAERNMPCPHPVANHDGEYLGMLNGKPATLVSCLRGSSLENPSIKQCAEVGRVLAEMHLAGQSFPAFMENPRGSDWRKKIAAQVMGLLDAEDKAMLEQQLAFEADLGSLDLPRGVIHADLFRDNVLFDGDAIGGVIDFYYACNDMLAYDLAIVANDWCATLDGGMDTPRLQALLNGYHAVRPLDEAEHVAWPGLLRIAALRFWLSRLLDLHFPQAGELTHAKDPQHFQKILKMRINQQQVLADIWV
jgi:homoserine kinase type II